jgi:hypothetical protein
VIKLRTHIISLTAVFLALGIGLMLGSTFLDRTFVDALDAQVKSLNGRLEDRTAEVKSLTEVLDEQTLSEAAIQPAHLERLLAGRLSGTEVVVLANRGVDSDQVTRTVAVLQAAEAEIPAVLWLTDRWNPADPKTSVEIADSLGLVGADDPQQVTVAAADLLATALAGPTRTNNPTATTATTTATTAATTTGGGADPGEPTVAPPSTTPTPSSSATTTTLPPDPEDLLAALAKADLIEPEAAPAGNLSAPAPEALIMYITGEGSVLKPKEAFVPVATALAATSPGRVLLAETRTTRSLGELATDEDVAARGASLEAARDLTALAGQVSTLDGLETPLGKVAAVAALMELAEGKTGNYGMAKGVDSVLPEVGG